ncbi:uncharacterized protein LOC103106405 [Monodelphis domestica]|uniref:uncharacterized protein LOC103106405 n=1 Tax=Monodelphis domestica TaxID=13616 RepID=UPI0024E20A5B|nr:uncharacterized protein LOC103106405 [Monodelphis domestica]
MREAKGNAVFLFRSYIRIWVLTARFLSQTFYSQPLPPSPSNPRTSLTSLKRRHSLSLLSNSHRCPPPFSMQMPHLLLGLALRIPSSRWARNGCFRSRGVGDSPPFYVSSSSPPPRLSCVAALPGPLGLDYCSSCCSAVSWKEAVAGAGAQGGGGEDLISGIEGLETNAQLPQSSLIAGQVAALLPRGPWFLLQTSKSRLLGLCLWVTQIYLVLLAFSLLLDPQSNPYFRETEADQWEGYDEKMKEEEEMRRRKKKGKVKEEEEEEKKGERKTGEKGREDEKEEE